jgi:hypothetical protein
MGISPAALPHVRGGKAPIGFGGSGIDRGDQCLSLRLSFYSDHVAPARDRSLELRLMISLATKSW